MVILAMIKEGNSGNTILIFFKFTFVAEKMIMKQKKWMIKMQHIDTQNVSLFCIKMGINYGYSS